MFKLSLFLASLALCSQISLAQNGYNYDRPDVGLGGQSARPGAGFPQSTTAVGSGYPSAVPSNFPSSGPTTPSYQNSPSSGYPGAGRPSGPSFPPTQGQGFQPQGPTGYPSAQADNEFPTGPASGYPSQRPQAGGFQSTASAGSPYPASGVPATGGVASQGGRPGQSGFAANVPAQGGFGGNAPAQSVFGGNAPAQSGFGGNAPAQSGFGGNTQSQGGNSGSGSGSGSSQDDSSQEGDYSAIPGEPEIDYPIFSEIPETSFDCNNQEFPGYYADVEARCQVFHICALNRTFNFLCPNGTIFSQEHLVCVWWNQFDCNSAPGLFGKNADIYDNTKTGSPASSGSQGDFGGRPTTPAFGGQATGPTGPYPSAGGAGSQASYPSAGGAGGQASYPSASGAAAGYPSANGAAAGYPSVSGPAATFPSGSGAQGYPAAGPPSPTYAPSVPSTGYAPGGFQASQADSQFPPQGTPQTPPRDYLPPRRG